MARTLVTGITGQDGSYLGELLLDRGDEIVGVVREPEAEARAQLVPALQGIELARADLATPDALRTAVRELRPDRIFHLAAPTFVPASWEDPSGTFAQVAGATFDLLRAVEDEAPEARVFLASSAEVFGDCDASPQDEQTACRPRSPYGVAKLAALRAAHVYRGRGVHVSAGILFNHESPRRPERFLPRKVTMGAARIAAGIQQELEVGDRRAVRDWSHARDVMAGAILAVEHDEPGDYVFASGIGHSVGELIDHAFRLAGLEAEEHVVVNPAFVRPPEATPPVGDPTRAQTVLGWRPTYTFDALVEEMVQADLERARVEAQRGAGAADPPA